MYRIINVDITPPAAINNLTTNNLTSNSITLNWTAPGDDWDNYHNIGTAAQYDIRYSTSQITESNWDSANQVSGETAPKIAGSAESFTVTNLSPGTTYYFAMKTRDEVPNWSAISNCVSATTLTPPSVTANAATAIATTTATLNANMTSLGTATSAYLYFDYGTNPGDYSNPANYTTIAGTPASSSTAPVSFLANLSGLSTNTTYHFRARAVGDGANGTGTGGDMQFTTLTPATISGETWEVKGIILGNVTVTLDGSTSVVSDSQGAYQINTVSGQHTLYAYKTGFRKYRPDSDPNPITINISPSSPSYTFNFKANDGLIPNAPNMTYVLACINKWTFPPEGLGLNMSKVLAVINAWKFPIPTLNPNTGPVGTVISVTGGMFIASTEGVVWFDSDGDSVLDAGEPSVNVTTTGTGTLPDGVTLTVPSVVPGTYYVRCDIPTGGSVEASASFIVSSQGGMGAGGAPPKAPPTPPKLLLTMSNPARDLPAAPVSPGQTFQVTVTFTAPANEFNAIGLTDFAPAGWNVNVSTAWCTPTAMKANKVNNRAEYAWGGPYGNATAFTAVYQVTVPLGTAPGIYSFANGTLEYYIAGSGPTVENVTGETTVTVQ